MPEETSRPKLEVISPTDLSEPIPIPGEFSLQKFSSPKTLRWQVLKPCWRRCRTIDLGRERFRSAASRRREYWTAELCFVNVPIKGQKHDTLHLIDEDLAMQLPAERARLCVFGWRSRPSRTTCSSSA